MNKYSADGSLKMKVLLGLVEEDGKLKIEYDKDAPLSELPRFFGILAMEVPFLVQYLKSKAARESIVVPDKQIVTPN